MAATFSCRSIVSGNTNGDARDIQTPEYTVTAISCAIGSLAGFNLNPGSVNNIIGTELKLKDATRQRRTDGNDGAGAQRRRSTSATTICCPTTWLPISAAKASLFVRRPSRYRRVEVQPHNDGPFAFATTPSIVPGGVSYQFTVTFSDPDGIDISTLIANDGAVESDRSGWKRLACCVRRH